MSKTSSYGKSPEEDLNRFIGDLVSNVLNGFQTPLCCFPFGKNKRLNQNGSQIKDLYRGVRNLDENSSSR